MGFNTGLIMNIILGIVGAVVGNFLLGFIGIGLGGGLVGASCVVAVVGACVLNLALSRYQGPSLKLWPH